MLIWIFWLYDQVNTSHLSSYCETMTQHMQACIVFSFWLTNYSNYLHRLWDLGQQRCVHSYAVHTDSVWALASTPAFSHVYSGGRDLSVSIVFFYKLANSSTSVLCRFLCLLLYSFKLIFLMPNSVYTLSYTWQTWQQGRVSCFAQENTLFCKWLCMMIVYGLLPVILLFIDFRPKDVTLRRSFKEAVHS